MSKSLPRFRFFFCVFAEMGRYTTARSFDDRSTEVQSAPTEAEKEAAGKKDILEVSVRACSRYANCSRHGRPWLAAAARSCSLQRARRLHAHGPWAAASASLSTPVSILTECAGALACMLVGGRMSWDQQPEQAPATSISTDSLAGECSPVRAIPAHCAVFPLAEPLVLTDDAAGGVKEGAVSPGADGQG